MSAMKKYIPILVAALCSFVIVGLMPILGINRPTQVVEANQQIETSILPQAILSVNNEPKEVTKIYDNGKLLGVLNDRNTINVMLDEVYKESYEEKFPNTKLDIGQNLYEVTELSYATYENIDDQIIQHIKNKALFTIEVTGIEISDDNGVIAVIYVDDVQKYENAFNKFLLYFVDEDSLNKIRRNETVPSLTTYGERDMGIEFLQTISVKKAYATADEIMTTEEEILEFLKYGEGVEKTLYQVVYQDTIEGVGAKNGALSAEQVVNINDGILSGVDQVLKTGEFLVVTYFQPPIDVVVTKESLRKEIEYPDSTLYIEKEDMYNNEQEIFQEAKVGSKNALYEETWINGVLYSGQEVSSIVTMQPQQEIIYVGTMQLPSQGTGSFRWPIDNPNITCRWGCYYGHRAIDIQNRYERYGNVYAADRGVVSEVSYNGINGNYLIIDHGNGLSTYYGHMNKLPDIPVGTIVDKGEVIGQIGMTGKASGPHVHFFILDPTQPDGRRDPCDGFLAC